jgi:hypothetical protein
LGGAAAAAAASSSSVLIFIASNGPATMEEQQEKEKEEDEKGEKGHPPPAFQSKFQCCKEAYPMHLHLQHQIGSLAIGVPPHPHSFCHLHFLPGMQ